ncbi:MAG TPA: ABC transporter ATP-binding protein [Bacteroidales bacterium]|nr:ABC transporter ATP-binding protein [Bacteroidales bacterium]
MMKIIEIRNVSKIYHETEVEVRAVDNVSVDFSQAEFAAIVGPSGSGKTTLLNLIGGLDSPTSGEIIVEGTDLSTLSSSKLIDFRMRNIGFVFQAYNLIPVLTASENIEFIMSLQKRSRRERDERTLELLRAIGLADRINSRPSKLSGGQQQRIAVARALASRPKFVLADEPTANLDSKSATTLLEIMEKLNHEEKITFIFSTHDPRVVKMAHRVITLEDGRIVSDDIKETAMP